MLLALRVAALVLLALAFARPYFSDSVAAQSGAATLVMIDTSVSMSAPGQFDAARERARRAIADAPATHAVGLVAFAQAADVIAPLSQDRAGALAALAQLKPGAGATRYRAALQGAADAFDGRSGRIVVVTDLQQSGWDAASDGGMPGSDQRRGGGHRRPGHEPGGHVAARRGRRRRGGRPELLGAAGDRPGDLRRRRATDWRGARDARRRGER